MGFFKAPKVDTTAVEDLGEDKKKTKKQRSALYETEGGILGSELQSGEVKKRDTLLGN